MKVNDIYNIMDEWAPFSTQMSFDNAGLLAGDPECEVSEITVCLDITADVVMQAARSGSNLIVSHHPVIFSPLKRLINGSAPFLLAHGDISAICAHTNLDAAVGGVNDELAAAVGLQNVADFAPEGEKPALARTGELKKTMSARAFAEYIKEKLGCGCVRYTDCDREIRKIVLCSGSGAEYLDYAYEAGADALLTGEAKHHELLRANELGICFADAGHFCTEHIIVKPMALRIEKLTGIKVNIARESEPALFV